MPATTKTAIYERIADKREELVQLCADLVRVPSQNPPGDTTGIVDVIVPYLREYGIECQIKRSRDDMPNIVATLKGARGDGAHVVFNGHIDVFPVDPMESWEFDPFAGIVDGERILGRGTADMKGGVAASVVAVAATAELGAPFQGRITLCLVSDEEMGATHGTSWLLKNYEELAGDYCIAGEPTGSRLIFFGERGVNDLVVRASGVSGPGAAYHFGTNAIEKLAAAIPLLKRLEGRRGSFPADLEGWHDRARAALEDHIGAGTSKVLDEVTLSVGLIRGGTNPAVSPVSAEMVVNFRVPFGVSPHDVADQYRRLLDEEGLADVRCEFMHDEHGISPATFTPPASPLVSTLAANVRAVTGLQPDLGICGGATDTRFYRKRGIQAALYGPRCYPVFAAVPNEYIYIRELVETAQVHAGSALDLLQAS
jgi:succinyl-diaminopimelate desuccinylase